MPRLLWLVYESLPHPDAVSFPAREPDARFVLDLLAQPCPRRSHLAQQFRNYLAQQLPLSPFDRLSVPCRTTTGLYHLVPWRLAKWLAHVLPASDSTIHSTRTRIQSWLDNNNHPTPLNPLPSSLTPQA